MKHLFLTIFILSQISCGTSKQKEPETNFTKNPPFSIEKIYSQKWVAGVKGGGSGTNLYIAFSKVSESVVFKDLYFRNKKTEVSISKDQVIGYFKNQNNRDVIMDGDATKEAANIPPEKIPFQLKENEAVISYSENGKTYFYKISNIEEKEMLAYPNANTKIEN